MSRWKREAWLSAPRDSRSEVTMSCNETMLQPNTRPCTQFELEHHGLVTFTFLIVAHNPGLEYLDRALFEAGTSFQSLIEKQSLPVLRTSLLGEFGII